MRRFVSGGTSDVGRVREGNEDACEMGMPCTSS
jgi:hypothetical protein